MKNSIENNLQTWEREHHWSKDGDEWDGQALLCGQPYGSWKKSLVETFILPNIPVNAVVLEIAPGHGRWSKEMVALCKELILVDLSPGCIASCRRLLASHSHVQYFANDGRSLAGIRDECVDFVWSFDSFVHMDRDTIGAYLGEIRRVLRRDGKAIIHHAGRKHEWLWLGFLMRAGRLGRKVYEKVSMRRTEGNDGWRSNMSEEGFAKLAAARGLAVHSAIRSWGSNNEFGIPRFGDVMTILGRI